MQNMVYGNCYLLSVIVMLETQKMFFGNCQLSTVTLAIAIIGFIGFFLGCFARKSEG